MSTQHLYHRRYKTYWLSLHLSTNSAEILEFADRFFDFPAVESGTDDARTAIEINCEVISAAQTEQSATPIATSGMIDQKGVYHTQLGALWADVACDPRSGQIVSKVFVPLGNAREQILDFCIHQPLQVALQSRGLTFLHASCVRKDDQAILICGKSGSGKSSLAVKLAQSGFSHWADDDVFLEAAEDGCLVHPLPTKIGMREFLIRSDPGLKGKLEPQFLYGGKPRLSAAALGDHCWFTAPKARILLLPSYAEGSDVVVTETQPDEWLANLADEHLIRFPEGPIKAREQGRNFEAFFRLSRHVRAFNVRYCEQSLSALPAKILPLLETPR